MKVLVAEDSRIMRRLIVDTLESIGYKDIIEAENGIEALTYVDKTVGLILTHFNMPGMDGLTLVKELKKNPLMADIPIIMITARGAKSEVVEALKHGVKNYIVKPFDKTTLLNKIKSTLKSLK